MFLLLILWIWFSFFICSIYACCWTIFLNDNLILASNLNVCLVFFVYLSLIWTFGFVNVIIHAVLFGHDEQILGMIIVSVVVVRADVYDLLELPSVRHGRQHLSDFGLFELNHPIDPFNVLGKVYENSREMWGRKKRF